MIHGIYANQASFQPVEFTSGLNIVVADRKEVSGKKDTRNGLGKSTLIEIINFCLGGSTTPGKGLSIDTLQEWAFTIEITLSGNKVKATRATASPNHVIIEGDTTGWFIQPEVDEKTQEVFFHLDNWKVLLGRNLFGLKSFSNSTRYKPSYRSLISYMVRKGIIAYTDPFKYFRNQKTWDWQLHIAFFLGLNWENASKWQEIRDKDDAIKAVEKAIKTGAIDKTIGSRGKLEAERVQLESVVEAEQKALAGFRVHPQYEGLQVQADQLTHEIHSLMNQNITARRKLRRYEESGVNEQAADEGVLEAVYEEAGLVFPKAIKKRLEDAKLFHSQVVENRTSFLATEVEHIRVEMAEREKSIKELSEKRADLLSVLKTHGAFEEFSKLQKGILSKQARLGKITEQLKEMRDMATKKREIKVDRADVGKAAELDYQERRKIWEPAVRLFNENSQSLYNTPGKLLIDISETGYKFDVEIPRSDSEGIGKMKLFCFDLMISQLMKSRGNIDFLVHDSAMFDGVDSRQRALALERAAEVSSGNSTQYICTMNTDMVPYDDFGEDFNFESYVRLRLSDQTPAESLLGIRF